MPLTSNTPGCQASQLLPVNKMRPAANNKGFAAQEGRWRQLRSSSCRFADASQMPTSGRRSSAVRGAAPDRQARQAPPAACGITAWCEDAATTQCTTFTRVTSWSVLSGDRSKGPDQTRPNRANTHCWAGRRWRHGGGGGQVGQSLLTLRSAARDARHFSKGLKAVGLGGRAGPAVLFRHSSRRPPRGQTEEGTVPAVQREARGAQPWRSGASRRSSLVCVAPAKTRCHSRFYPALATAGGGNHH